MGVPVTENLSEETLPMSEEGDGHPRSQMKMRKESNHITKTSQQKQRKAAGEEERQKSCKTYRNNKQNGSSMSFPIRHDFRCKWIKVPGVAEEVHFLYKDSNIRKTLTLDLRTHIG